MMKLSRLAIFGLVALLPGCEKNDTVPTDQLIERKDFVLTRSDLDFIRANNGFALELFKRVAAREKGKSTLISPLSVTVDFGMVNNGARGGTQDEINRVLGYEEGSVDDFNAFCQSMLRQSAAVDPSTLIDIANAAVVNKGFVPLKDSFTKTVQSIYDAEVIYKDFSKDDVKGLINRWCSEKTHGMIPVLLEEPPKPSEYAHFLNAVYFKGIWSSQFKKSDTKKEDFRCGDGTRTSVRMMWQTGTFNYGIIPGAGSALCLPYGNQAYRMILLLPLEGKSVESLLDALDLQTWNDLMKGMSACEVDVKVPVFETATPLLSLKDALMDMGIRKAFSWPGADFHGMTDTDIYIGDVLHKARIKVDETGSEAAAVTDIVMRYGAIGPGIEPKVIEFHCDRPFLYAITEVSSGALYFIGQYTGN